MADKYTIQIQPQIGASDAQKMEQDLNRRFSNVAKKFGSNLGKSIKSAGKYAAAGIAGFAIGGITAALTTNPIERINQDLDQTLDKFDNAAQKAEQFGVDAAKYFRAERIAQSYGVQDFETIINRFSSTLEAARTGEDKTLINFTQDENVIDAFNAFTASISQLTADERNAALDRVFGGRMGLRVGDLAAQSQEQIAQRNRQIFGNRTDAQIAAELNKMASLKDLQDINRQKLVVDELKTKSATINEGILIAQNAQERARLSREVQQLTEYQIYAKQALLQEKMLQTLDKMRADTVDFLFPLLQTLIDILQTAAEYLKKIFDFCEMIGSKLKKWLNKF